MLAGGRLQQEIDARHALAVDGLVAFDRQAPHLGRLLRREVGRQHGLRPVEQVLVFVIVELARGQDLAGHRGNRRFVAEHRALELAAGDAALDDDLAVVAGGAARAAASSSARSCAFEMPTDEPRFAGFTNNGNGKPERRPSRSRRRRRVNDAILDHRQPAFPAQALHDFLVHRQRRRPARPRPRRADRPVPAVPAPCRLRRRCRAAPERRRRCRDCAPGSGRMGRGLHLPVLGDEVMRRPRIAAGSIAVDDRFGGAQRDFVLAAAPAVNHRNAQFHRIRLSQRRHHQFDGQHRRCGSPRRSPDSLPPLPSSACGRESQTSLHGQVRLAVGDAAAHRRADAGRLARIDGVHVEREVKAGGARADAIRIASSITARRPRSSMSRMVKARTPDFRTCGVPARPRRGCRPARHCAGPPSARSRRCGSARPGPVRRSRPAACRARCRWGWSRGVFMSAWASIQMQARSSLPFLRKCCATPGHRADGDRVIAAQHQRELALRRRRPPPSPPDARRCRRSAADSARADGPVGTGSRADRRACCPGLPPRSRARRGARSGWPRARRTRPCPRRGGRRRGRAALR